MSKYPNYSNRVSLFGQLFNLLLHFVAKPYVRQLSAPAEYRPEAGLGVSDAQVLHPPESVVVIAEVHHPSDFPGIGAYASTYHLIV